MNNSYSTLIKKISLSLQSIWILLLFLLVCSFSNVMSAGTKTSTGTGNWNTAGTWSPSGVPAAGDDVIITSNHTVTVDGTFTCASLVIGPTNSNIATLNFSNTTQQLTVTGLITLGNSGNNNRRGGIVMASGGTLICQGFALANAGTNVFTSGAGTVIMTATNTIPNTIFTTFNNLTISAGTTTFGTATTIANNFYIATSAIANLGTFTHTAGTITLGGVAQVPESWGSTSSLADNKNNIYFASTTGIVNNSCTAPTITTQPVALTICENSGGSFSVSATGVSAYQWQYSADNINWTNTDATLAPYVSGYTASILTLSNIPVSYSGNYVRCVMRSSTGCRTNSNSVQLTVSPTLSAPTIGTITQPTCSTATGSVVLNGLPTGSWVLTRTPGSVTTTGNGTSTTISGLVAGTTYSYSVNGLSNGLKGEYYNNMNLTGSPVLTRTDATVNFDWVNGSPDPSIANDAYSVRWSGLVQPQYSETYTFSTNSDDGIRLWVNGVQIIDNWTNHATTTNTGTITLTAGVKYNIVLEYYENSGGAVAQLSWSCSSQTLQIIPTTRLFPIGSCASAVSTNIVINAQPGTPTAPTVGIITQPTCSIATASVVLNNLLPGSWLLTRSPGSITTAGAGTSTTISGLVAGTTYTYSVNGLSNGLKGEYYSNMTLAGSPVLTRTDATVGFNWGVGSPDASIPNDGFSVRWSGYVQPLYSQTYTFSTSSDDGIRLWVNGVQIINNWTNHGITIDNGNITLTAGVKYSIVLEFFENAGDAISQLSWSSPSQGSQIIPQSQLYSTDICGVSPNSSNIVINAQPATPSAPTGTAAQSFCSSSNPTVASLTATGTTIQWYVASSGGSVLPSTTALVNGNHYYATQTNTGGCESTSRFDVTATINTAPLAPATSSPYSASCSGFTAQWGFTANATAYYIDVATDIGFTSIVSAYNNLNVGNVLNYALTGLNPATTYYYRVRAIGCSTSANSSSMSITTSSVAVPGTAVPYSATCTGFTAQWGFAANATTYYLDVATDIGFTSIIPAYNNLNVGYVLNYALTGLNPSTTYYYRVRAAGCGTSVNSATMNYTTSLAPNVAPVASAASSSSCTAVTVNWATVANATGYYLDIATDSGFTSFVSGYNNYNIGYSTTSFYAGGLPAGTLYYRLRGYNSCGVTANSNTISFSASPSTPTVGTITQPSCITTGSVVLSDLPASGTVYQTGTVVTNFPITGTTMTVSGLAAGTYNFSASNGTCTSSVTGNVVLNAVVTNTWNGSTWSNGTPSASQVLTFNGNYPPAVDPNVDIAGCSCTVNTTRNVIINSGRTLTITNGVTVSGTGSLTFENTASLVQINDAATNSGTIIYKRNTTNVSFSDYTYWSSPVAVHTLNISPSYVSGMFYSYDDFATPENWKKETAATSMTVGKGYIIRGPQIAVPPPPSFYTATFTGVPNTGSKTIAIGSTGRSVLLGNPYPSALDAEAFLDYNTAVLEGTIYFWTHKTAIQAANPLDATLGTGFWAYTSNDYAAYNALGGVAVGSGSPSTSGSLTPSGKIAAGQGFFGTSKATGSSVTFNNSMRLSSGGAILDNTQFFRTTSTKNKTATTTREKHRIWLDISNTQGAFKQALIGYVTDATNNYEDRFDGVTFDGNEFIDFYSINQDKNLVIQGRALPFDANDEVPLGFKTAIDGAFTININKVDGLLTNQEVFLEDKLTNTVFNLKTGNYTFNTAVGTFNERFVLKFTNKTLGTGEFDAAKNQVVVSLKNKQIKINSYAETIAKVVIYDLSGKLICQKTNVNANELVLVDFTTNHQVLVIKTTLENGKIVNDKVIF